VRIFIVSEYVQAHQNSTGYFWSRLIEALVAAGHEVCVLTLQRPVSAAVRVSVPRRALAKVLVAFKLALQIFRQSRRGDTVLCGTNPELLLPLLAAMRALRGFRWHVLVHDVFPENLVPAGVLRAGSIPYRLLKGLMDRVYRRTDGMFVIGRDMQQLVDQKIGVTGKTTFVHNWVGADGIQVVSRHESEMLRALGWQDRVVFQFFGNIGRLQGIATVLEAIGNVRSSRAAFLFAGSGTDAALVREFQQRNPERPVHYLGEVAPADRSVVLGACDVAIVALQKGMFGLGVPSKAYFTMAANRPILAIMEPGSEVSRMVEELDLGWSIGADDPLRVAELIDHICQLDLSAWAGRPRAAIEGPYSDEKALQRVMETLNGD
jgi:glycosyltransferase involved in cell wall biosynthesis